MKSFKTLSVAVVLLITPGLAFAMGCSYGEHEQQVQSCVQGTSWDAESQACVPVASS